MRYALRVVNCRKSTMKLGNTNDTVEVEVILGRRLIGTFMTIYMPTILLNIIGHSTNYFKPFFFEAVVTVNLTVKFYSGLECPPQSTLSHFLFE